MKVLERRPIKGKEGKCTISLLLTDRKEFQVEETHFGSDGKIISNRTSHCFQDKADAQEFMTRQEAYLTKATYAQLNESDY